MVRQLTNNEDSIPTESSLNALTAYCRNDRVTNPTYDMLWERLQDFKNLRHVEKSLLVVNHLILHGTKKFIRLCLVKKPLLLKLTKYVYKVDGTDIGQDVRRNAKHCYDLLQNEDIINKDGSGKYRLCSNGPPPKDSDLGGSVERTRTSGEYEKRWVDNIVKSGGVGCKIVDLPKFVSQFEHLSKNHVLEYLDDKLEDFARQKQGKALALIEALLKGKSSNDVAEYFSQNPENVQSLLKSKKTILRKKANAVMGLLELLSLTQKDNKTKSLVNRATTDDRNPPSGYLLKELAGLLSCARPLSNYEITNPTARTMQISECQTIEDLIVNKLAKNKPYIKYKALRVVQFLCETGSPKWRRAWQRNTDKLRDAQQFRGPPDPIYGDAPYQQVRKAAKDAMHAVFVQSAVDSAPIGGDNPAPPHESFGGLFSDLEVSDGLNVKHGGVSQGNDTAIKVAPRLTDQQAPPSKSAPPDLFDELFSNLAFSDDAAQNRAFENENLKLQVIVAEEAHREALKQSQVALNSVQPLRLENKKLKQTITEWKALVQSKDKELDALKSDLNELRLTTKSVPVSNHNEMESLRSQIATLKHAKNESDANLRVEDKYYCLHSIFDGLTKSSVMSFVCVY